MENLEVAQQAHDRGRLLIEEMDGTIMRVLEEVGIPMWEKTGSLWMLLSTDAFSSFLKQPQV